MPLSGGATDKFGNYYEGLWTVDRMLDILDEQADSIYLEPPLEEGFEFLIHKLEKQDKDLGGLTLKTRKNGIDEYHQVKTKSTGHWTINALETGKIKVLSNFKKKLAEESKIDCVFVCNCGAPKLNELSNRARQSKNWTDFIQNYINTKEWRDDFSQLCEKWSNSNSKKEIDEAIQSITSNNSSISQHEIIQVASENYEILKRIKVRSIDKTELESKINSRVRALIETKASEIVLDGNYGSTVISVLARFALEKTHHELRALDIWNYLHKHGFQRKEWGKNSSILAAVQKCNSRYVEKIKESMAIKIPMIDRDESVTALAFLKNSDGINNLFLVGQAGIGKSAVMLQIIEELQSTSTPILVFRIDNLNPTSNPDELGKELGLPASPAFVISNIAKSHDKQGILVIDQLDAVSIASGRNATFFDCIASIIKEAQQLRLKLVLACRTFDLNNDQRFKRLINEEPKPDVITIQPLANKKIKEIVVHLGLNVSTISQKQLEILSIPLHLGLLAEISEDSDIETLNFTTVNDLFNKYWIFKQQKINQNQNSIKWTEVIDRLCDYMSKKQVLSTPQSIVDQYFQDVQIMISENVLVKEGSRIRFFHESFFDYAFARRFAGRDEGLLSFLREDEQHLFKRSQVRQILLYERDENFEQYLDDLNELLTSSDIRFHIKQLVLALLSTLNEPTREEFDIIYPLIEDRNNPLNQEVWIMFYNSLAWFKLLNSLGKIEEWLKEENNILIDNTVLLLRNMQRDKPRTVAELLYPFVDTSEDWNNRLFNVVNSAELHSDRYFLEFFLELVKQGYLDKTNDFLSLIYSLSEKKSDWACEVIAQYLNRRLDLYLVILEENKENIKKFDVNPFERISFYGNEFGTIKDTQYSNLVLENAEKAPQSFVEFVFPFILKVIELTVDKDTKLPWADNVWRYRSYGSSYSIDQSLLQATEIAFSSLAKNNCQYFSEFIKKHELQKSDFETIQFLLIRAYTANGKYFANEAVKYICENSACLKMGYSGSNGNIHAAPFWATRELLQAITLHCTHENLTKLEDLILNYYPYWKKYLVDNRPLSIMNLIDFQTRKLLFNNQTKNIKGLEILVFYLILFFYITEIKDQLKYGQFYRGYAQLILLDAIDSSRISDDVNKRLQEWRRKFIVNGLLEKTGDLEQVGKIEPPKSIEARFIGSPIPQDATQKMNDEQWLKAIAKYNYTDGFKRTRELIGSASQLSSELEKEVRKDPKRFAQLTQQFSTDTHTRYFDAVLRGIAETELQIDVSIAFGVCKKCHQLPEKPCGAAISRLFEKLAHFPWHEEALDVVIYYALNDPNPQEELWRTKATEDQIYYSGDILTAGINSTRGQAITAIAKLIFKDKNRTAYFQKTLEKIVRDSSIAVRSCVAEALTAVLNYDRDLAVRLFIELCDTEDALLKTSTVDHFLYYALSTHFNDLEGILNRMINSDIPEIQEIGAKRICVVSISSQEAQMLAQKCLSLTENHRKGAAMVYARNLQNSEHKKFCEQFLTQLFNNSSESVRSQAAEFINDLKNKEISEYFNIIDLFIDSLAFEENYHSLLRLLTNDSINADSHSAFQLPPKIAYKICKRFIEVVGSKALDIRTGSYVDAQDISQLLIRIYSQNQDSRFQISCLELIDTMCKMRLYGLDKAISEYER